MESGWPVPVLHRPVGNPARPVRSDHGRGHPADGRTPLGPIPQRLPGRQARRAVLGVWKPDGPGAAGPSAHGP